MPGAEEALDARRRLAALLAQQRRQIRTATDTPKTPDNGPHPLHPAQDRIWFLEQLSPQASRWNVSFARRLTGALNLGALTRALDEIVRRHEPLRAAFDGIDGVPFQTIHPPWHCPITLEDLSSLPEAEAESEVRAQLSAARVAPFDIASGRLLRTHVWRMAPARHVLLIVTHHIVCDGWSIGVLLEELITLYRAYDSGREAHLRPIELRYVDFVRWLRDRLDQGALDGQLEFWKRQLTDIAPLSFSSNTRLRTAPAHVPREFIDLPAGLECRLESVARAEGSTLFAVLATGLGVLLHRYTGQRRFAIGVPVAGRLRSETEHLIGPFLNTIPLVVNLGCKMTLADCVRQMKLTTLEALANQEIPFDRVVNALRLERSQDVNPLFQVSFAFQNAPVPQVSMEELTIEPFQFDPPPPRLDLEVDAWPDSRTRGIVVMLARNPAALSQSAGRALIRAYEHILREIVDRPGATVESLDLTGSAGTAAVMSTAPAPAPSALLHEWVAQELEAAPDRVAVTSETGELTCGQVLQRCRQVANWLRHHGVGEGALVGVCVERNETLPSTLLGILSVGAAYVPLDPDYPVIRLNAMVRDAGVRHIITDRHLADRCPPTAEALFLDSVASHSCAKPPSPSISPQHRAYVIYTSGSTGAPKGVEIGHQAACAFLAAMRANPGMVVDDVLLAVTPISFDISVLELFLPLVSGARVAIASREAARDPFRLARAIRQTGATMVQATPSTWQMLVDAGWPGQIT